MLKKQPAPGGKSCLAEFFLKENARQPGRGDCRGKTDRRGSKMIQGIGVDLTEIKEIKRLEEETGGVFTARTFTQREQEGAAQAADRWEYLAGRYAAKEAVFKALAHLTPEKTFDFRTIETCSSEDGSPYVVLPPILRKAMKEAGVGKIHISLTHEKEYACAFAVAELDICVK